MLWSRYRSIVAAAARTRVLSPPMEDLALRMKILVVDDHVLIREALRGVLKELKGEATIIEASDSRQAAQRIGENPDWSWYCST